jgi:hypothetical protein
MDIDAGEPAMSIDTTAGLGASWGSQAKDLKSQAIQYAAMAQQVRAERGAVELIERGLESPRPTEKPPAAPPPGQGQNLDVSA